MSEQHHVLSVPAKVENLNTIRGYIKGRARPAGAPQEAIDAIVLAVDEAATNVIQHGYIENGRNGSIEIEVVLKPGCLCVILRDDAPPFDPSSVPDPDLTLPLELRPIGGLGIFLMRKKTDALAYTTTPAGQNELTLTKYYPPQEV